MKLLFVSSYHYPGRPAQFKHALIMAREYAKLLKDDSLYVVLYNDPDQLRGIPHLAFNPFRFPLRNFKLITFFLFFYLGFFFAFNKSWRGNGVVTITQESKIAAVLLFWKNLFGFKVIYECHGLHAPETDRFVCRESDAVVFVTKQSMEEAQRRFGTVRAKLLPNAVDESDFKTAREEDLMTLRKELGMPTDKKIVGYVGRFRALGFDKGIENMLRALRHLDDQTVVMCFVGGTEAEIKAYIEIAERLGVRNRAHFYGYQSDNRTVARFTAAMDVLAYLPPPEKFFTTETSPMKLYEYMAVKKPIVVSDFSAMREILPPAAALFVDPLNERAVASALHLLLQDVPAAAGMAERAYAVVKENTWEKRAKAILL